MQSVAQSGRTTAKLFVHHKPIEEGNVSIVPSAWADGRNESARDWDIAAEMLDVILMKIEM